jgi:hypothetical protein
MIPVYQTIVSDEARGVHGNCLPSCIASILEVPLEEVPPLQDMGTNWFPALWDFLISKGYEFHGTGRKENVLTYTLGVNGYYIVNGSSPRGFKRGHSVVFHEGKLVHDPHPSGLGVPEIFDFYMIEPMGT